MYFRLRVRLPVDPRRKLRAGHADPRLSKGIWKDWAAARKAGLGFGPGALVYSSESLGRQDKLAISLTLSESAASRRFHRGSRDSRCPAARS